MPKRKRSAADKLDPLTKALKVAGAGLEPCPFCGRRPELVVLCGMTHIRCTNEVHCICPTTHYYGRAPHAIKAWNTRAALKGRADQ